MAKADRNGDHVTDDEVIRIRGARVHNLKNLDVDIPRGRFVVITGPSGSGKSTLANDTLCAEGQRQYVESLSVYARQFLHQMERPDVDLIEGLQPTIAIDQRAGSPNPRSTVATATEIYDYLRLLMARLGDPSCYVCGAPIQQQMPEQIVATLAALPEGTKAMILAPMVRGRKGEHRDVLAAIRKAGFVRVRIDGQERYDMESLPDLAPRRNHDIEAVVDRVVIREAMLPRITESLELALQHGDEKVIVCHEKVAGDVPTAKSARGKRKKTTRQRADVAEEDWQDRLFSTRYACPQCNVSYEEVEPRTFSFNSPYGACATCDGLGAREEFDPELIVPNLELSLADGAVLPWKGLNKGTLKKLQTQLSGFLEARRTSWDVPLSEWTPRTLDQFFRGDGKKFHGLIIMLEKEYATTTNETRQHKLAGFRGRVVCPDCGGARLCPEARSVRVGDLAIHEITAKTVTAALQFFGELEFAEEDQPVYAPIQDEIVGRLQFLEKVGVDYLSLDRSADSLSGGERQRVRLATGIGSGLVGVCYVLDEPSIGLHPRDNRRLISALRDLQELGNTVLVVEHDEAMMRDSDHLIDMGPGAGAHGGEIVAQGTPQEVCENPRSVTGRYLTGTLSIPVPSERRRTTKSRTVELTGASTNNLKDIDVRFPLGAMVCVTGVSGSGKSSLVNETLACALARRLNGAGRKAGPHRGLRGVSQIDKLIQIDQMPIGRSPRSNPATYTGVFDEIRKVYAGMRAAKQRGFGVGRFSFNVKGGRCEVCQGQGQQKIDMNFLPDLYVTCNECGGARFNRQTLEVRYRDLSIAEVLQLQIEDALKLFENIAPIHRTLECMADVGLGYLTLGQSSITLSGGEAQRIKLATELARSDTGNTLYILDEPTTGLHFDDIRKLLDVLGRLVDVGNTVIVIEHNLDVIKSADWIIDLGPEGGDEGGRVVATGPPEEIAALTDNHTGQARKPLLNGRS